MSSSAGSATRVSMNEPCPPPAASASTSVADVSQKMTRFETRAQPSPPEGIRDQGLMGLPWELSDSSSSGVARPSATRPHFAHSPLLAVATAPVPETGVAA